ncbi:hypothetical protein KR51_00006000 [Rubidibacter lacunae KORDI 51-2]|uniref:DyP dimeric alpha+beta barrel domain-containing protein n=1 Tax=Rubidibacter lacunae KORDI 51-2 TaxID=582515 RepID=U5DPH0_9CHRO|nr:hypothetical protein [Rubidibacter lacunae]ERN42752.1 hypothetical protein KR51_00006000 [Rubidibacter lacunae KORDI 51-2]
MLNFVENGRFIDRDEASHIDLFDVQGNLVKAYGRFEFTKARYIFYRILGEGGSQGRAFVRDLVPEITNGAAWDKRNEVRIPPVTTNIAFTFTGLKNLGLPLKSLKSFPPEFMMGMKARRDILGDDGPSAPEHWDPIWQQETPVDIMVWINARKSEQLETRYQEICGIVDRYDEVEQVIGHRSSTGENLPYQDAAALLDADGSPTSKEHFGYVDGISEPYFKGSCRNSAAVVGGGKLTRTRGNPKTSEGWEPLETGEFILGYRDEAEEYPVAPIPRLLSLNGTFLVYRKLHQNVMSFRSYIDKVGQYYPDGKTALMAKFSGRWPNGAPLALFPTEKEADDHMRELHEARENSDPKFYELRQKLEAFNFDDDLEGSRCPVSSHTRRTNPRGSLEFGKEAFETPGALIDRRRLLRRGLPYGKVDDPARDDGDHGIIFMALGASIERQFEFVQQQWINYGNDFKLANERDPLLGNHGTIADGKGGRMVIEGEKGKRIPFFCANMPRFVETRGGDYFFLPSITGVRMIGEGIIDPT